MSSYQTRMRKWVRDNDLKIGDKVKVVKKWNKKWDGGCSWVKGMDKNIGKILMVRGVTESSIMCWDYDLKNWWWYPYFVLEKVEEETKEVAKEETMTYEERQKKWIEDNDIHVGDCVKVTRLWTVEETKDNVCVNCVKEMEATIGTIGVITDYDKYSILVEFEDDDCWWFPYFVLEKVEKENKENDMINPMTGRVESMDMSSNTDKVVDNLIEKLTDERTHKVASKVDHPSHYNTGKVETIKILKDFLTDEEYKGFLKGNIIKYLHRYEHKNGIEDLDKASWYLNELKIFEESLNNSAQKVDKD